MSLILNSGEPCDPNLWEIFRDFLSDLIAFESCDSQSLRLSRRVLEGMNEAMDCSIDIPATLAFFEERSGYCDCEVLMNVDQEEEAQS